MLQFESLKEGYEQNWKSLAIRPARLDEARREAQRVLEGRSIYQQIEATTNVPWWFVGLCHYRESHFNFDTYLGNGQSLSRRTTIVPIGRGPFTGPYPFVDGAIDALRVEHLAGAVDWSIARTLYRLEGFNGFGYQWKGVHSPYLYGGSTLYGPPEAKAGKFIRDHVFDPNVVDPQLGTAVILKTLTDLDPSIEFGDAPPMVSVSPEPDDEFAQTILMVQQSLNKLGADPQLVEDGKNGPRTKDAVSRFQQLNGLPDTGLPDAATVAAIAQKSSTPLGQVPVPLDSLLQIIQRLTELQRAGQPSTSTASPSLSNDPVSVVERVLAALQPAAATKPGTTPSATASPDVGQFLMAIEEQRTGQPSAAGSNDPVGIVERVLGALQKGAQKSFTTPSAPGSPDVDRLQKSIALLTAILGKSPLGQVNGAMGETIGNLLNGRKTAIGIGGSLITSLLAAVTSSPDAGGLAGLLGTVASSVPGLSQFTMPIFLAMTVWGILGKFEKWSQGTATLPAKPRA
ncbi:MAG TPA: peptidoglycan-binding protein [Methylocella sp.]|nr:peptidoglycan-binding protein [Methylocella sp.]